MINIITTYGEMLLLAMGLGRRLETAEQTGLSGLGICAMLALLWGPAAGGVLLRLCRWMEQSAPGKEARVRRVFWVSFLDQMYWVIGCAIGGLAGSLLTLNTKGIDFVMNAMFLVIALNSIEKVPARIPALLGLGCSLLALALFGPNRFLIPAMILILIALMIYRPFEQRSRQ